MILSHLKRLVGPTVKGLRARFLQWTKPFTSSLPLGTLADFDRSKAELVAENALLRQQLIMLKRQVKRPACMKKDRMLLVLLARAVRTWKQALFIVQPETLLRWHRELFRLYWKRRSKVFSHKPRVTAETIALIREMATNNRLCGAERIRGELLKLDIHVCKRTIQKYMRQVRTHQPAGLSWATFLSNHSTQIWCTGYFVYPFQSRAGNSTVSNRIVICLKDHRSEKGRDSILHGAFFRTDILSSQYTICELSFLPIAISPKSLPCIWTRSHGSRLEALSFSTESRARCLRPAMVVSAAGTRSAQSRRL